MYSAVIEFNEGCQGIQRIIEYIGLDAGSHLVTTSRQRDVVRVNKMIKKSSDKGKKRRKTLRGVRKGFLDKEKELATTIVTQYPSFLGSVRQIKKR